MCGITAKVNFAGAPIDREWLERACRLIAHRGPDGERIHLEGAAPCASVALGHRRLRVIDLSPAADQPMQNAGCVAGGRARPLTIIFNGEIYNYRQLRQQLLEGGHRLTSDSDTEVVLHLYEENGAACVRHLRGMFAFAIWDASRQELFVARDRVGKKPLYYRFDGLRFWLASEARAILADPEVPADVDADAVHDYLELGYVPGPGSAAAALRRLPPAHSMTVSSRGVALDRYWELRYEPKRAVPEREAVEQLRCCLKESVALRMIADVPLGAFLSGGIDSSAVVALMHEAGGGPPKTFSIGFEDEAFNELPYARIVASRFATDHHEFVVRPNISALLPTLAWHYSEPFADSSAIPSFYLAEMTKRHVTVALNGDGGDESFAGYRRYRAHLAASRYGRAPEPVRAIVERISKRVPAASSRSRLYDVKRFLESASMAEADRYASWFGFFPDPAAVVTPAFAEQSRKSQRVGALRSAFQSTAALHPVDQLMLVDVSTYLPDDLLVKVDTATMAYGLEARSPLLDHELMELAARLPVDMKLRGRVHKYALKQAVKDLVPNELLARRKVGFGVPLDRWLKTDLSGFAHDTLLSKEAVQRGYLDERAVRRMLLEHQSGTAVHGQRLWALLMLELWLQNHPGRRPRRDPAHLVSAMSAPRSSLRE